MRAGPTTSKMQTLLWKRLLTTTTTTFQFVVLLLVLLTQQGARGAFLGSIPKTTVYSNEPTKSLPHLYSRHHRCHRRRRPGTVLQAAVLEEAAAAAAATSSAVLFPKAVLLLWSLRIGSAAATYIGFVTYFDRPRGTLAVNLQEEEEEKQQQVVVEIKPSSVPGAGLGLFAKTFLPKDTVLGTYPGAVVPLTQNLSKLRAHPACEGYIWRFSDNRYVIDPTNAQGMLEDTSPGGNPSMPGSVALFATVIRPFFSISTALCRINEPPKGMDVNVVTTENLPDRSVVFSLERDVMAGEELFIDYGLSYDRSRDTAAL